MVDFLHHRRIHTYVHTKYAFLDNNKNTSVYFNVVVRLRNILN